VAREQEVTSDMKNELFETKRDQATRRVMRSLPSIAASGGLVPGNDDVPLLIMLPDDTVAHLTESLARVGGTANVVIAFPDRILLMSVVPGILDENHVDTSEHADVHMLTDWIGSVPDNTASFSVKTSAVHAVPVRQLSYA
jgi:hypothetical protein